MGCEGCVNEGRGSERPAPTSPHSIIVRLERGFFFGSSKQEGGRKKQNNRSHDEHDLCVRVIQQELRQKEARSGTRGRQEKVRESDAIPSCREGRSPPQRACRGDGRPTTTLTTGRGRGLLLFCRPDGGGRRVKAKGQRGGKVLASHRTHPASLGCGAHFFQRDIARDYDRRHRDVLVSKDARSRARLPRARGLIDDAMTRSTT